VRTLSIVGIVLIALGIGGLVFPFIPFHHREEVAKIGPITATRDKETDIFIPSYVGILAVVVGAGLLIAGRRTA
jgi:hypothetical protein